MSDMTSLPPPVAPERQQVRVHPLFVGLAIFLVALTFVLVTSAPPIVMLFTVIAAAVGVWAAYGGQRR